MAWVTRPEFKIWSSIVFTCNGNQWYNEYFELLNCGKAVAPESIKMIKVYFWLLGRIRVEWNFNNIPRWICKWASFSAWEAPFELMQENSLSFLWSWSLPSRQWLVEISEPSVSSSGRLRMAVIDHVSRFSTTETDWFYVLLLFSCGWGLSGCLDFNKLPTLQVWKSWEVLGGDERRQVWRQLVGTAGESPDFCEAWFSCYRGQVHVP